MSLSLKKQIHCKKISRIIKTKNLVLFFALLDSPQRGGVLKRKNAFCSFLKVQEHNSIFSVGAGVSKKKAEANVLYVSNKCLKTIAITSDLPLYGQTLLVACDHEKQAAHAIDVANSLYKGVLCGGFYKNTIQTKAFLKNLCVAGNRKKEIYTECLRLLCATSYRNLKATATIYCKTIALLRHLESIKSKTLPHRP